MSLRVVVLDDWEQVFSRPESFAGLADRLHLTVHRHPLQGQALHDALSGVQVLVLNRDRTPVNAQLIASLPELRYVIFTGPRNGTLDLAALQARGIPASGTAGGPARATTVEHTWALILAAMRRLDRQFTLMREGGWRSAEPTSLPAALHGSTLGLLGLGHIGGAVARVAQAFQMRVLAWSPSLTAERAAEHGAEAVPLDTLLAESHVLSVHLASNANTHHFVNAERLSKMREGAVLVNTARGSVLDTQALINALNTGPLAAAALDVYETEPFPAEHPLRQHPNVLLAPHTGFVSEPAAAEFLAGVREALAAWLNDQPLPRLVTPPTSS